MESSILSEVDDTSILRTGSPRRYGRPLNWLPASRLLPRAAGWSAATLCAGASQSLRHSIPNFRSGSTAAPAGLSGERLQGLQHRTSRRRMVDEDWNLENQTFCL